MVIASHIHAITGTWCHKGLLWEYICIWCYGNCVSHEHICKLYIALCICVLYVTGDSPMAGFWINKIDLIWFWFYSKIINKNDVKTKCKYKRLILSPPAEAADLVSVLLVFLSARLSSEAMGWFWPAGTDTLLGWGKSVRFWWHLPRFQDHTNILNVKFWQKSFSAPYLLNQITDSG